MWTQNHALLLRMACLLPITFGTFVCERPAERHNTTTPPIQSALDQRAIESLRQQGASVTEEGDMLRIKFTSDKYDLAPLADLTAPLAIDLSSLTVRDDTLATIAGNPQARELNLAGCTLTDAGIASLGKLRNLRILNMESSRGFSEAGLRHLRELTHLESLDLSETPLTDEGLKYLSRLTQMKSLRASYTQISDAGSIHLKNCTRLDKFYYYETMVTPEEAANLLAGRGKYASELQSIKVGQAEDDVVTSLVFSPDGKSLACATMNGDLKGHLAMLDVDSLQVRFTTQNRALLEPYLAFMPDSKTYWTIGSADGPTGGLVNCDTQSGNVLSTYLVNDLKKNWINGDLHLGAGGTRLVALATDNIAVTMIPPQKHWTFHEQEAPPRSLDLEAAGRWCIVGDSDGRVGLWDLVKGRRQAHWKDHKWDVAMVAISREGALLASADEIEQIIVRDRRGGKILWQRVVDNPAYLSFTPDEKLLVYGDSYPTTITIINAHTGRQVRHYRGHEGYVKSAAVSPDGKVVATGGDDGLVKFWEMPGK